MPNENTGRLRVTCYLTPSAYEAFALDAMRGARSVSAHLALLIEKHLAKSGARFEPDDGKGQRSRRSDFAPHATLAGALGARKRLAEREAERYTAKIEKLTRTKKL